MEKNDTLTIRINSEEKKELQRDAASQQRSIANFLIWLWREWRGKNRPPEKTKVEQAVDEAIEEIKRKK